MRCELTVGVDDDRCVIKLCELPKTSERRRRPDALSVTRSAEQICDNGNEKKKQRLFDPEKLLLIHGGQSSQKQKICRTFLC